MKTIGLEKLSALQKHTDNIRNICILAHVDHGKTTLADSLLASNGIISQRLAGKLRYMDSRKDEQERGITMKSSSISLHYSKGEADFLVNLIDSPGHVDFSSEVSTAVRLCDGAAILIDVVEGICSQTKVVLRQAWMENLKPVLVLNKMDRLITECKMTPLDAYIKLQQIMEQVNAIMGELFTSEVLERTAETNEAKTAADENLGYDWDSGMQEADDSNLFFSPQMGNVIFASAVDGWAFGVFNFARLYAAKLGFSESALNKTLWGDFYLNTKTKRIMKGAQAKAKKTLFVQFILENIWAVYDAVLIQRNQEMTEKIVKSLGVSIHQRDTKDSRVHLQSILTQWLTLANAFLEMVCCCVPSPAHMTDERAERLMCNRLTRFASLPYETRQLKDAFVNAKQDGEDVPLVIFISKMFAVEKKSLPKFRKKLPTAEDIVRRREEVIQKMEERKAKNGLAVVDGAETEITQKADVSVPLEDVSGQEFIAFARVYSGTVSRGQAVYVLGPKHNPAKVLKENLSVDGRTVDQLLSDEHVMSFVVSDLYILMGRELEEVDSVPAGNVLGIGGLQSHVLKSATLSDRLACPAFTEITSHVVPILRVALEPRHPVDIPALVKGLKLLNQADPCVQVFVQENGEHVLVTAGEVHLERCVDDLRERFAQIEFTVSDPIVPFRETVVKPPEVDMTNELIDQQAKQNIKSDKESLDAIEVQTANKQCKIRIRVEPLPESVTTIIEQKSDLIKALSKQRLLKTCSDETVVTLNQETIAEIDQLKTSLVDAFSTSQNFPENVVDNICSFGPKKCGPNLLICDLPNWRRNVWLDFTQEEFNSVYNDYENSFITGFQLATAAGPLCEEPMMGVGFVVEEWTVKRNREAEGEAGSDNESVTSSVSDNQYGPFSGQVISAVRDCCRRAFQTRPQRLMAAMYSCSILVTAEVLGKMYAVLGKRNGRVLHGDLMQEGSQTFRVTAIIPVIESLNFAKEIRKQTSGQAQPQLVFSHWEVIDIDPFWEPRTEEEYLLWGDKWDTQNRALHYMNLVRRRKGLHVLEQLVQHAEKQRTHKKNK